MITLDAHCDSPSQMFRLRDFGKDNPSPAQVDFPKMRRGGLDASFFALYVPARLAAVEAYEYALRLLECLQEQVKANSDTVAFAFSSEDVRSNKAKGLVSILIGLENASPLGESLELLHEFHERGVRYITLTHSRDNQVCDSCTGDDRWGGLSPFGRELVVEMNRIGMLVDLAHCSDRTVEDVLSLSTEPVVSTHGCCRSLNPHRRNLPDSLIRGIAAGGGVVGMSIYPPFLDAGAARLLSSPEMEKRLSVEDGFIASPSDPEKRKAWENLQSELLSMPRPGVGKLVGHISHAVSLAGAAHVGIGTDFDGIEVPAAGLDDVSRMGLIWSSLAAAGYTEEEISGIAGGNFLRLI